MSHLRCFGFGTTSHGGSELQAAKHFGLQPLLARVAACTNVARAPPATTARSTLAHEG
jgi:hypothetical protein